MSHYAHLDENDNVINVIVVDKEKIESGQFGDPRFWVETDRHTSYGIHYGEDGKPDGKPPFRGNHATIGGVYDRVNDVFYTGRPFLSWRISGPDWIWKPPVPKPPRTNKIVNVWNESTHSWDQFPRET
jgi:hypothetical protein